MEPIQIRGGTINVNTGRAVFDIAQDIVVNTQATSSNNSSFRFTGGAQQGGVVNLTGDFSTDTLARAHGAARLVIDANIGFQASNRSEGRWNASGDWSEYQDAQVVAIGYGTLQIDAQQAIADSSVRYGFNGNDTHDLSSNTQKSGGISRNADGTNGSEEINSLSSKLILNGAFTMANNVTFENANNTDITANSPGDSIQSVGATHASGTAEISGTVSQNN